MEEAKKSSVWIIGAGFSRHAGGPLMNELFSKKPELLRRKNKIAFFEEVGRLYRSYGPTNIRVEEDAKNAILWNDPEQFLELLDTDIEVRWGREPLKLSSMKYHAILRLCYEVNYYIERLLPHSDRVQPYRHWLSSIGKSDTIISFNYDSLVETIAGFINKDIEVCFTERSSCNDRPRLLKLHGSVNLDPEGKFRPYHSDDPCERLIATPGSSKGKSIDTFRNLWDEASKAISEANYVYILGYRFPESDSSALMRLLHPMRSNEGLRVKVVLGIHVDTPEIVRLKKLLEYNLGAMENGFEIVPMYAQDFMIVENRWSDDIEGDLFIYGN
ncbi:hypothetical protein SH467x_000584 [Pirellulaceae bacterium SH467]